MVLLEAVVGWKLTVALLVFLLHVPVLRFLKGFFLAVLVYFALPDPSDMIWMPMVANYLGVNVFVFAVSVYVTAWVVIWFVWKRF